MFFHFFPICHQLSPSSHSQHLKISFYFLFPSFPKSSSSSSHPFQFLNTCKNLLNILSSSINNPSFFWVHYKKKKSFLSILPYTCHQISYTTTTFTLNLLISSIISFILTNFNSIIIHYQITNTANITNIRGGQLDVLREPRTQLGQPPRNHNIKYVCLFFDGFLFLFSKL